MNPLPTALLIPSALLAGISALGIRTLRRRSSHGKDSARGDLVFDILLGASLLIFAAALTLPGANAWGLGGFWLLIAAEELWAWRPWAGQWFRRPWSKKSSSQSLRVDPAQSIAPHVEPPETPRAAVADLSTSPAWPANDVTQQLTRSTAADGSDLLSGWLRLDFAPRQRIGSLHVAFCPPFAGTPQLTASQLDGPETRIKIAQLLPYGARLDLKLIASSEEPAGVLVQFSARAAGTKPNCL